MKNYLQTILFILVFSAGTTAQQVVSSAGEQQSASEVQISWTLGEPVITTTNNSQYILTQGFQQSKLVVTAIKEISFPQLSIKAYPNPTSEYLNLELSEPVNENLEISMFDVNGKLLMKKKMVANKQKIKMKSFAAGSYLLKIATSDNLSYSTFKILKK